MNASGDRRYRRCSGLRHSFGNVKEETVGGLGLVVVEEEELNIEIDRRLEKKEDGGDD